MYVYCVCICVYVCVYICVCVCVCVCERENVCVVSQYWVNCLSTNLFSTLITQVFTNLSLGWALLKNV